MAQYDFQTINDKEFEELCKDLLNRKYDLDLQSFRRGRDKGIDLRLSTAASSNSIVVQAKQFGLSGYKLLYRSLEQEVAKVKTLNPDRYILATSVPLTAANQTEIKKLFHPYIKSEMDVIGNETLNSWLEEFPDVVQKNFKLLLSSTRILELIMQKAILSRSAYHLESIIERISLYVPTKNLSYALKILHDKKAVIISGEPGIGKSTLGDIICLRLMAEEFTLFKLHDLEEGEAVFSFSPEEKQLFLFDDFLGSIYLELTLSGDKTDSKLNSFIQRVRKTPNKLLIFTTRTVILNQAFSIYEKFKLIYSTKENIQIKLSDYSKYEKGLILYNHLYHRNLAKDLLDVLYEGELYMKIINHKNYSPRIVDFISAPSKVEMLSSEEYKSFIRATQENPETIWDKSFHRQINDEQRFLLLALFSFKENMANEDELQTAYDRRVAYEVATNGHKRSANSFYNSRQILLNGFISRTIKHDGQKEIDRTIAYINPSLGDYIKSYLSNSEEERIRLMASFAFVEQHEKMNASMQGIPRTKAELMLLVGQIKAASIGSRRDDVSKSSDLLMREIKCLLEILPAQKDDVFIIKLLNDTDWEKFVTNAINEFVYILRNAEKAPSVYNYIGNNFEEIIKSVLKNSDHYEDHSIIKELFEYYEKDFELFMSSSENRELITSVFQNLFNIYMEKEIEELQRNIKSEKEADELADHFFDVTSEISASFENIFDTISVDWESEWHALDWSTYVEENNNMLDYDSYHDEDYERGSISSGRSEDSEIRDLFERN